jgi:hypothetical protein
MKIRSVGAELFHSERRTDVQTDMTKLIVAFRSFANALTMASIIITKKIIIIIIIIIIINFRIEAWGNLVVKTLRY